MSSILKLTVILAFGLAGCVYLASFSRERICSPGRSTVDFRQAAVTSRFRNVKMVATAAFDTLSKAEMESGAVPRDDWARLTAYLTRFQARHPDFRSEQMTKYISLAEAKSR